MAEDGRYPVAFERGDTALVGALLNGSSVKDAAAASGMSERTAYRRLSDEGFRLLLDEGRREIVTGVAARLAGAADLAVSTLIELATDGPPPVRRNAAKDILAAAAEFGSARDVDERLSQIEAALERFGPRRAA